MDDRQRLMLLNLIPDMGSLRATRLLQAFGNPASVFAATEPQLRAVEGIGPVLAQRIVSGCRKTALLAEELHAVRKTGCAVVIQGDAGYPQPLRTIADPPLALYLKGAWTLKDQVAVAIVGSRHASVYGQQTAQHLAYELALRGVTVVSGLARGIDAAAHRGALQAKGRTLAVLGNGLSRIYPPEHAELAQEIIAHGALISEYPMGMMPLARNFPPRNRLISGLSLGVVVVEAAGRSGALITADCALEQGREVFAVPGKVDSLTSQGTNRLLKQGARLVTSVEDILEELRLELSLVAATEAGTPPPGGVAEGRAPSRPAFRSLSDSGRFSRVPPHSAFRSLSDSGRFRSAETRSVRPTGHERIDVSAQEQRVLAQLQPEEPIDVDVLAAQAGLPASTCVAVLLGLELKHLVKQLPGKRFITHT